MEIIEINGHMIKAHKTSITCIDSDGKTIGVVRNLRRFADLPYNVQFELHNILNKSGLWSYINTNNILSIQVYFDIYNHIYVLYNVKCDSDFHRYFESKEGFERERENYYARLKFLENLVNFSDIITVLRVSIY